MTIDELETRTLNKRMERLERILFCYRWRRGSAETKATLLRLSKEMLALLK